MSAQRRESRGAAEQTGTNQSQRTASGLPAGRRDLPKPELASSRRAGRRVRRPSRAPGPHQSPSTVPKRQRASNRTRSCLSWWKRGSEQVRDDAGRQAPGDTSRPAGAGRGLRERFAADGDGRTERHRPPSSAAGPRERKGERAELARGWERSKSEGFGGASRVWSSRARPRAIWRAALARAREAAQAGPHELAAP